MKNKLVVLLYSFANVQMHFLYQQRKLERLILGFLDLWSKNTALQTAIDLGKPMSAFFQWILKSLTTCMFRNILATKMQ